MMTNEETILQALEKMQTQMDTHFEKLESDIASVRILVDVDIDKKLNLLAEGHQTLLDTLAPKNRVEQLEEEVSTLKAVVRILAEKVDALGAAG